MRALAVVLFVVLLTPVDGFQPLQQKFLETRVKLQSKSGKVSKRQEHQQQNAFEVDGSNSVRLGTVSRQRWLRTCLIVVLPSSLAENSASAAAPSARDNYQSDIIWLTGKDPIVPGQVPRDKNDVKGTRKDPDFLRSVADCKNQCENSTGPDGLARSKEQCLSDCQDICCKTYQQCTFGIVPRI